MNLIDTHAHLNFAEFDADREQVIKNSISNGIFVINAGVNYLSSAMAIKIAQNYNDGVWAAIGLHPLNLDFGNEKLPNSPEDFCEAKFEEEEYLQLAKSPKVVAVGEIGLDYYHKSKNDRKFAEMKTRQIAALRAQFDFARELDLPIIFHCRAAHNDLIGLLKDEVKNNGKIRGVLHCFTGGVAELNEYLALGLHIGLDGIIFKIDLDEAIKAIPLDRILLETDCPYLTPPSAIGRNEPQNVKIIAQKVAQIRGESLEALVEVTTQNAKMLFGI